MSLAFVDALLWFSTQPKAILNRGNLYLTPIYSGRMRVERVMRLVAIQKRRDGD